MFPDWSDVDILFALQETEGDESLAVTRIAEGKFNFLAISSLSTIRCFCFLMLLL
jgi:hypothetical protein